MVAYVQGDLDSGAVAGSLATRIAFRRSKLLSASQKSEWNERAPPVAFNWRDSAHFNKVRRPLRTKLLGGTAICIIILTCSTKENWL